MAVDEADGFGRPSFGDTLRTITLHREFFCPPPFPFVDELGACSFLKVRGSEWFEGLIDGYMRHL